MTDYSGNEINIEKTRLERYVGVTVRYDLKCSGHVNRMDLRVRTPSTDRSLCFSSKAHLEYFVQVWNPNLQGDIGKIKRVQKMTTKISLGFA